MGANDSKAIDRSLPAWKQWVLAAYHSDVRLLKELLASGKVTAATTASETIEMPGFVPIIVRSMLIDERVHA